MKNIVLSICLLFTSCKSSETFSKPVDPQKKTYNARVPLEGNGWFDTSDISEQKKFETNGLTSWNNTKDVVVFFSTSGTGKIDIGIKAKVVSGKSSLNVSLNGTTKPLQLKNVNYEDLYVGEFTVTQPGYQKVTIKGISKEGGVFADIEELLIGGEAANGKLNYVKDDFYWGRRGPSVHFSYVLPEQRDVEWLYNEITVKEGDDVEGSYYMANGFAEGYFGIQVNSKTERRILFSVWSPYSTDNPNDIPEDQKIVLLKKGENVNTGEFGNEGSGGQSFKRYNWKAGNTYRFLTKIVPSKVTGSTEYTSYFYAPELNKWELIASFRRPKTVTYAKRFHSFLENFETGTGHINRSVSFSNQWVCDVSGEWHELTTAKYTADATARKGNRIDYAARVATDNRFVLTNCGFFSPNVPYDTMFSRTPEGKKPNVNLKEVEKL